MKTEYKLEFEVLDVTGKVTTGYTDGMDERELPGLQKLEDINSLTHFSMPVTGTNTGKIYYNPKHIVSIIVKMVETNE
jgi:hypothetical protein